MYLQAQDITGTWEGTMSDDQFLQINIIQVKNKICGYTWDSVFDRQNNFCKAYFTANYNARRKEWRLDGTSFINSSSNHFLMELVMKEKVDSGKKILSGYVIPLDSEDSPAPDIDINTSIMTGIAKALHLRPPSAQDIRLEKISEMPTEILDQMKDCLKEYLKEKSKKYQPTSSTDSNIKKDDPSIPIVYKDTTSIEKEFAERGIKEEKHIVVNSKTISLALYDNALIDGDTVSVFFNNKLLVSHQLLSEKPINIDLQLNETDSLNKLVLFAENLGSIPPNTALIIVNAAGKRYELFASASLTENSVLVFEYRPPDK